MRIIIDIVSMSPEGLQNRVCIYMYSNKIFLIGKIICISLNNNVYYRKRVVNKNEKYF